MIRHRRFLAGLAALVLFNASAAHAAESYDNCTGFIDSVPAAISTQGVWCLRKDLATSLTGSAAIAVATNNVTIDCNDFKLGGLAAGPATQSTGVFAYNRQSITIRNCNIRGFLTGVHLSGGGGHVVEDNRLTGNTHIGIDVVGEGSLIRRNIVTTTGGSTHPDYLHDAFGINAGNSTDIIDNTIDGVSPTGNAEGNGWATGIYTWQNLSGTVSANRVRGVIGKGVAPDWAIANTSNGAMHTTDNLLTGSGRGIGGGIACDSDAGTVARNLANGFDTAFAGCTDAGGNFAH
jgi:parallel beta-helix repeat protein